MSGYEEPPPTNTDYFNTLFYYNSQGSNTGGSVNPATLLSYPTAQGLEYFPAGINMGNAIAFSNTDLTKDVITGVATVTFVDNTSQTTAYNPDLVGQLAAPNVWASTTPNQFTAGLKFSSSGATQTVPYDVSLVGQLAAGNIWSNTTTPNKFVAGIQFNDNTIQTTAATNPTSLLSSNNSWSGTNTFSIIPSTTSATDPTASQFVTVTYGNKVYPRLATNNLYSGINTFDRIAATTCSCADFTSNTLTCTTSIDTPSLTGTNTTVTTLTLNGTTYYDSSGFNNYYSQSGYKGEPTVYWTAPNTATAGKFVWSWPYQGNFVYMDGGGINYIQGGNPNASFLMDANDVTIRGTSWNQTVATLNYIKNFLFKNQTIPPP